MYISEASVIQLPRHLSWQKVHSDPVGFLWAKYGTMLEMFRSLYHFQDDFRTTSCFQGAFRTLDEGDEAMKEVRGDNINAGIWVNMQMSGWHDPLGPIH